MRRKIASTILLAILFVFAVPSLSYAQGRHTSQASCYGPYEGEYTTALGTRITKKTKNVAVPMQKIVSKKLWQAGSYKYKRSHFYYGDRIKFKRGKKTVVAKVVDCGGFYGCGCYYKGAWIARDFDLQPAVFTALGMNKYSTSIVKWKWL